MTTLHQYHHLHTAVRPIMQKAEQVLLDTFGTMLQVSVKEGVASQAALVTQADEMVDSLFRQELTQHFPDFGFITEEGKQGDLQEYNWIIDPLDGTTNFSRNFPFFGISLALWQGNTPIYGCISIPKFNQHLSGGKGAGIFLNDQEVQIEQRQVIKPYVLLAPVAKPDEHARVTELIGKTLAAPRDFGCCVYQSFETIMGKADINIGYKLSLWDIGAAVLLAKEAGLAVEYISPQPDIYQENPKSYAHTVLLGKPALVEKLAPALREE